MLIKSSSPFLLALILRDLREVDYERWSASFFYSIHLLFPHFSPSFPVSCPLSVRDRRRYVFGFLRIRCSFSLSDEFTFDVDYWRTWIVGWSRPWFACCSDRRIWIKLHQYVFCCSLSHSLFSSWKKNVILSSLLVYFSWFLFRVQH